MSRGRNHYQSERNVGTDIYTLKFAYIHVSHTHIHTHNAKCFCKFPYSLQYCRHTVSSFAQYCLVRIVHAEITQYPTDYQRKINNMFVAASRGRRNFPYTNLRNDLHQNICHFDLMTVTADCCNREGSPLPLPSHLTDNVV